MLHSRTRELKEHTWGIFHDKFKCNLHLITTFRTSTEGSLFAGENAPEEENMLKTYNFEKQIQAEVSTWFHYSRICFELFFRMLKKLRKYWHN